MQCRMLITSLIGGCGTAAVSGGTSRGSCWLFAAESLRVSIDDFFRDLCSSACNRTLSAEIDYRRIREESHKILSDGGDLGRTASKDHCFDLTGIAYSGF